MSKTRRGKASQEKRQRLEQWERFPVLSVMYDSPEQYAEALRRVEEKGKREEYLEEHKKASILVNRR